MCLVTVLQQDGGRIMKTVYWASFPGGDENSLISELSYSEPVSLLKDLNPTSFFGMEASRCPAIINESKNTFKINSPIDLSITFNSDFTRFNSKYAQDFDFIQHFIGTFGAEKVIQLSAPSYLFFCEESLTMTQLPPYYEQSSFVDNCIGLSATFNINSWFRPVKPSFKLRENKHTIEIDKKTSLMYLKFNTEEKINLVRFDGSAIHNSNILNNIYRFKFHKKNPLVPTKLSVGYDAFLKARYNKKIIKIIKENLL
jgi:hypothetical protein